jgi:uncharacterized repeat protein (TIGR01451 family)
MMMNSNKSDARPRRALSLLLSGLLATLIILGLAQWTAAEDDEPAPLIPDSSSIYKDRMLTEEEIAQIEDPVERYITMELLSPDQLLGSDLSTSTKEVDRDEVQAGSELQFTIVISNSGDTNAQTTMIDALPAGLSYVSHERVEIFNSFPADPEFSIDGDEITWNGALGGGGYVEIAIKARIDENVPAGTMITNNAQISGGGESVSPSAEVKVLEKSDLWIFNMPIISFHDPDPPDVTNFQATRPNSKNQFKLSWTGGPNASFYIVEQANNPGFTSPIQHNVGRNTFLDLQPKPSWRNDFYFRVRAFDGGVGGNWSDTVNVVGAYYDEFDDPNSGWKIRRSTHLDHVNFWYEIRDGNDWIILEVGDKWDWGLSSPLAKAPEPPYVIEFDGKFAQTPNEVAMGVVFAGDKPGNNCPDYSSANAFYRHKECFNHFYNPQWYWAGEALHLIWQRVDELVWCPDCGGSPMKRRGDTENLGQMDNVKNDDWNRHRIEVRNGNIKYYAGRPHDANLTLQHEYNDTRWINDPYFGVFAYAGEYTSSVARYEYFSVTPLDS